MNAWHDFKSIFSRFGADSRGSWLQNKILFLMMCAISLALFGCSAKGGKTKVVTPTDPGEKTVVSSVDSLVKANKGKGKGVITGFLTGENKSVAVGILGKMASNAAGERRFLTKKEIPLHGATILVFNALKPTTVPDTTLKTDSNGNYTCVLTAGKFFGFAVYLDLQTFQLVTTSIPNMNPKADTAIKMDTATAIEDVTSPTVVGVYDASTANSDGLFMVGSVADKEARLNITFSEPMNRESIKGVVLGKVDTTNTSTSMVLADTVKGITVSWSGDSKELTLKLPDLTTGAQYGLVMPVGLKDLAKNPLEKQYKATFLTVAAATLASIPFSVTATFPEDKGEVKPIQNPGVSFSRPVEAFSILKNAKIDPPVIGYFEISGARAVFIHKDPLAVGKTYTITMPVSVLDLAGTALAKERSFSFTVKDFEGAAKNNTGKEKDVALAVEAVFDAYLAGDIGRFGAAFHQNFRLYDDDGSIKSKTEFLDKIRKDVGDRQAQSAGFLGPIFDNSSEACKDGANINRWKVAPEGGPATDFLWVDAFVSPGHSPRVYGQNKVEISNVDLAWDKTGPRFTYKGKKYGFGPDMTKFHGPVNMDAAKEDMRFMGDMLRQTSNVVLDDIKLDNKSQFLVDPNVVLSMNAAKTIDTAKLAVKMIDYRKYNRVNFGDAQQACKGSLLDTSYQILRFILVNDGSRWMVMSVVSPAQNSNRADYDKNVDAKDFAIKPILPINLVSPLKQDAMASDGKITFEFDGVKHDSVGGYVVGIAEDFKFCFGRSPYGALIFVKASNKDGKRETLIMNSASTVGGTNAVMIMRRPVDLKLPGWERTLFENAVLKWVDVATGFGGVYNWKVIAVKDTSAVQFIANGFNPDRFLGESDFGPARGYFACKSFPQGDVAFNDLQRNQEKFVSTQPVVNNAGTFSDMDLDGVPDAMEIKYKTDPRDRNSYPDFRVDTDGDGLADFMEAMLDPKGTDSLITKKADAAGLKSEIAKLTGADIGMVWLDTDGDGFPNDVEMMVGFNPNDPMSNPGTKARVNAPIGVFSGKVQIGGSLFGISFKLYTDSTKKLFVAYTAYMGRDTLVDTVRAGFNDLAGEVYIAITLPKNGPDAGRALLLRGHYEANLSLLMGPIDMIPSVDKASISFGSGPYVGQFAASGRGEDVSRYLQNTNANSNTGTVINNPVNNTGTVMISYRTPPTGFHEGSKLIFVKDMVTLIDDFGDTLAVISGLQFRPQPDGSFQFFGETKSAVGTSYRRNEIGGSIVRVGDGWVVDGHLFQESDSAGVHKQIPGQINGKASGSDVKVADGMVAGTFIGWIAQDKTGAGFATQPTNINPPCDTTRGPCNPNPVCDPTKAVCNTQTTCDPAKGPCNTEPVCDPTKGPCGNSTFAKAFMGGAPGFKNALSRAFVEPGGYFFVQMGGRIYRVKNDSNHVMDAKSPWCGQVVLALELIDPKDGSDSSKAAHKADSLGLPSFSGAVVVAIEDQFTSGVAASVEKARDSYGDIHTNVFMVENRPTPLDYGKLAANCQTNINPTCDPTKQTCNAPCDSTKPDCGVPCDPTKGTCIAPCDTSMGPCGSVVGSKPLPYLGLPDPIKAALSISRNVVGLIKDTLGTFGGTLVVDPATLVSDAANLNRIKEPGKPRPYLFMAEAMDQKKLKLVNNMPVVYPDPTWIPPTDTTVVSPPDTSKPVFYKGTMATIGPILTLKVNRVKVMTPNGPVDASVNPNTVLAEGGMFTVQDASSSTRVYVFLGDKADPTKLLMTPMGDVVVMPKPSGTPI